MSRLIVSPSLLLLTGSKRFLIRCQKNIDSWLFEVVLRQRLGEQRMEGLELASKIDREQVFSFIAQCVKQ